MFSLWPDSKETRLTAPELSEYDYYDPFWEDFERSQIQESPLPDWREPLKEAREKLRALGSLGCRYGPEIKTRLKTQLQSPEFWLGVAFGVVTRLMTKFAIAAAFPTRPDLETVVSFVACAGAGITAGIVTHLVRTFYRNSKVAAASERDRYAGRALIESAVIGLFGGILGGYATNVGTVIVRAGSFAVGASVGVAAAVLHTSVMRMKAAQAERAKPGWGRLTIQGAFFGAVGGILGVVSEDAFTIHSSVAAPVPVGDAGSVIYTPPATAYVPDYCGTGGCGPPPPLQPPPQLVIVPAEPVHPVVAAPQEPQPAAKAPVQHKEPVQHKAPTKHTAARPHHHHPHHHHPHHHHPHARPAHQQVSQPKQHITPKRIHHYHRPKITLTPVEHNVVVDRPGYLVPPPHAYPAPQVVTTPPPPQIIMTPPAPPVDPCETGACASPGCAPVNQVIIQGPCADPGTACVEKVSFNEKGAVTKVVLQPHPTRVTTPYFEVEPAKPTKVASWSNAARGVAQASRAAPDASRVALIMPFVHPTAQPLIDAAPTPV
ncbi:MAG TPA: hypothetical protein DCY07_07770 [Rhodospirillaceae bacterium]|nr:hypothetical protein [Rhodospirillaceae bacterium]